MIGIIENEKTELGAGMDLELPFTFAEDVTAQKMRTLVISDIHGDYDRFINLLSKAAYNPSCDRLILLGDYIDRGPEPMSVLQKVAGLGRSGGVTALKGNHEDLFVKAWEESDLRGRKSFVGDDRRYHHLMLHYLNGGEVTWSQLRLMPELFQAEVMEYISKLPSIHVSGEYVFVHAGIDVSIGLDEQEERTLLWSRDNFIHGPPLPGKIVVFGHTPTFQISEEERIWFGEGKIGIDCGASMGGKLACLEIPSLKEYYA